MPAYLIAKLKEALNYGYLCAMCNKYTYSFL